MADHETKDRRTLLVLGASLYQMPVIERAKARGYRVVTTDNVPSNPGHRLADAAHSLDTADAAGVLELARMERVDGVIAACTDVAVASAALVASTLGLRGPSPKAAAVLCDKIRFRAWLEENGLPAPRSFAVDPSDAKWPGQGPWVLKPARSSGSKGIFVVRSESELAARLTETLAFCPEVLLESFVPGAQLTCEGFLRDGAAMGAWVTRRETAPAPYVATWGHLLPSGMGEETERAVIDGVIDVLARLGVHDGPFDADIVWDGRRCHILEATPRLGGNSLSRLVLSASGFDLVDEGVECACGHPFALTPPNPSRPSAIVLLGVMEHGRLSYAPAAAEALRAEPWVLGLQLDKNVGDVVEPFINGRHRVGEALITADDLATLELRYAEVRRRLALGVE